MVPAPFPVISRSPAPSASSPRNDRLCPSPASPRGAFVGTVKENRRICTDHFRLVLDVPGFPRSVPGQFIQLDCRDPHAAPQHGAGEEPRSFQWPPNGVQGAGGGSARPVPQDPDFVAPVAYLRRPFSIADHRVPASEAEGLSDKKGGPGGRGTEIDIIHRVVGRGTQLLARLEAGERVSLIGPLGMGFTLPPDAELACLVGGGVGIPPMLYLARALRAAGCAEAVGFVGALRRDLLPVTLLEAPAAPEPSAEGLPLMTVQEFAACGYPAVITTDDGSLGMKGFVTQALRRFFEGRLRQGGTLSRCLVYCCGPTPMMKATAKVAAEFQVPCQVSLEQPMACGMGTCQSCIIRYRPHAAPAGTDWKYKLTCTDGPVFDTRDIVW